ncbi:retinol dehydrogenase 12-like [Ixodes scapularis]|uniref:retinol dehydrogenase 12-like n=1 Tax=Ixodes scapularis TaxID=6945 RepID=UPI001A9CFE55|nr:retinol dehydrogenase 12-like [Ixodes scapularis]
MKKWNACRIWELPQLLWMTLAKLVLWTAAGALCLFALFVRKGVCRTETTMEGKTVIVTGGSSGMGKATAKELARRKARVIIACCDLTEADQAAREIFAETKVDVIVKYLDLASFESVRGFAQDVIATEPRLDVLINNAGIMLGSEEVVLTLDGYERAFQVNYLGPFLLTMLLVGLLKASAPCRVINMSSMLHLLGSAERFEDRARGIHPVADPLAVYCDSKLAIVLFTRALAATLHNKGVTVNAAHPGLVRTSIALNSPRILASYFSLLQSLGGKTALEGAQTTLFLAVHPVVGRETGAYYSDCKKGWVSRKAINFKLAQQVFRCSMRLVHLEEADVPLLWREIK